MPVRSPALVTSFPPLDISADGRLLAACVLVGAATRELERELVSGEGRQLGGSIPRAIGCNEVALQPGGAERGPPQLPFFRVSGEGCLQEASARDVEDGGGVAAATIPRGPRQGRFGHSSHWGLWIQ